MPEPFVSLDCEANGLHGQIFAAAAVLYVDGIEAEWWGRRTAIRGAVDPWVAEHVLPALDEPDAPPLDIAVSRAVVVHDYRRWYDAHGGRKVPVIAHIPWPVEARFLWDAHHGTPYSGPYPLIDVAMLLLAFGRDPTTVDGYLKAQGLPVPSGSPHHPLYDARAAATAYLDLLEATRA